MYGYYMNVSLQGVFKLFTRGENREESVLKINITPQKQ